MDLIRKIIDTHAHVYQPVFDVGQVEMIKRAEEESVVKILMPAIDAETHERMIKMEEEYPQICHSMMGVHPCSIKEDYENELKVARAHFDSRSFIAVGEIGLDFYWDKTFVKEQYVAFEKQIEWALEFDIPIVIHSRNATDECIEVVKKHQQGKLSGVFHCFSGTEAQANALIDLGFYLGIGGVVTFKNAGLDAALKKIPLKRLLLETDAPYLAPMPYRGKQNEPAYLKYIVEKLAVIKNCTTEEVCAVTTSNAALLFGLDV